MAKGKDATAARPGLPRNSATAMARRRGARVRVDILLAEDSPFNRTITLALLQGGPYRVDTAENGAVACRKFTGAHYDLVLMDRQMPVMDGLAATRAIRQWESARERQPVPIIALTASTQPPDRDACLAAGCTGYLAKPVKQQALLQAIREHCPAARRERQGSQVAGTVRASSSIADLIPAFLENRRHDVVALRDALDRSDFATVASIGHGMHGTGVSYGFAAITEIGAALERAAGIRDAETARQCAAELASYLDRVGIAPD